MTGSFIEGRDYAPVHARSSSPVRAPAGPGSDVDIRMAGAERQLMNLHGHFLDLSSIAVHNFFLILASIAAANNAEDCRMPAVSGKYLSADRRLMYNMCKGTFLYPRKGGSP